MDEKDTTDVSAHVDETNVVPPDSDRRVALLSTLGQLVNASGHPDQLKRQYGLLSICGLALTVDNAWVAVGSSLTVAVSNGGPAGVIYELIVAVFYYCFIAASIAELASAIPSAGGVYHWASITPGPRVGRILGFYAGLINFFGWIFDLSSIVYVMSELVVQMYALYHPDFLIEPWHVFVALVLICWLCVLATIFGNRTLPSLQSFGLFMVVAGGLVTVVVLAAMPSQHADAASVWTRFEENNLTGWPSGVAFLTGTLNGCFAIGTVDSSSHLAEDMPNPRKDLPRSIAAQMGLGFITAFAFVIVLFYGINDLTAVVTSNGSFPLAEAYSQATNSTGATFGLLFIVFLSLIPCLIGTFLTVGRIWWALARDNATPFSGFFSQVNERLSCPIPATVLCGVLTTAFGAITLGSKTGFSDLVGSFVILSTTSYALAVAPNVVMRRQFLPKGYFHMGRIGLAVNAVTVLLIIFFNIMFCFPYTYPTATETMNYNSVILVGIFTVITAWWGVHGVRKYPGPKLATLYHDETHLKTKLPSTILGTYLNRLDQASTSTLEHDDASSN